MAACSDQQVAESAIEEMLDEMADAVDRQDSQQLLKHFTDNATIHLMASPALGGDMEMGIKEYRLMLELSWSLPAEYLYEVKDLNIMLIDNFNRATVTDKTYESIIMQDEVILSTVTEQTLDVIFIDGRPKIRHLQGEVAIYTD